MKIVILLPCSSISMVLYPCRRDVIQKMWCCCFAYGSDNESSVGDVPPMVKWIIGSPGTYPRHARTPGTGCKPMSPHFSPFSPIFFDLSSFPIFPPEHPGNVTGYTMTTPAGYILALQQPPLYTNVQRQAGPQCEDLEASGQQNLAIAHWRCRS